MRITFLMAFTGTVIAVLCIIAVTNLLYWIYSEDAEFTTWSSFQFGLPAFFLDILLILLNILILVWLVKKQKEKTCMVQSTQSTSNPKLVERRLRMADRQNPSEQRTLGDVVRSLRQAHGMGPEDLADQIGEQVAYLLQIERDEVRLDIEEGHDLHIINELARVLGIDRSLLKWFAKLKWFAEEERSKKGAELFDKIDGLMCRMVNGQIKAIREEKGGQ